METRSTTPFYKEDHPPPGDMDLVPERLPDNQARKECKAAVDLPRDQDEALCEMVEPLDGDLEDDEELLWEHFGKDILNEFPKWRQKQEEDIKQLRALADKVDTTHEITSKVNIVATSAAILSGFLSIAGIALAPVTAGGSLGLTAASQTLGAAAGVTSAVTHLIEHSLNKKVKAHAHLLQPSREPELEQVDGKESAGLTALTEILSKVGETIRVLKRNKQAYRAARAKPRLAKAAKDLIKGGRVSTRTSRHVQRAFEGTPLAMTKTSLLKGGGAAALFLLWDLYNFSEDWKKLKDGDRAQLAEDLRAWAQELEEEVIRYSHCFERLGQVSSGFWKGEEGHGPKSMETKVGQEGLRDTLCSSDVWPEDVAYGGPEGPNSIQ
ncbi:apolipoprotein L6 isoform X3 [Urocitellus parryii]